MRQIGTIADQTEAERLADYLLTLGITTRLNPARAGGWEVWVHREERVEQARRELEEFLAAPAAPKYQGVSEAARAIRKQAERTEKDHAKNTIQLADSWASHLWHHIPLTLALIAGSTVVALLSDMGSRPGVFRHLYIAEPRIVVGQENGVPRPVVLEPSDLNEVRDGQVWRLITPIFIHADFAHLFFNMVMLFQLGGMVEYRRGTWQLALLVLMIGVASNLGQFYFEHSLYFGGMSGVVYGLFGYIWMEGQFNPEGGLAVSRNTVMIMMIWLFLCMTGSMGPIANAAHVVGLIVGMGVGFAPHVIHEFSRL